jgi:NAD(P)-dependent dehydrogenase (short-subunit alcohol dehydrogenase family)
MKNFQDKVVVITGAGSGMGRALAINFSRLGAQLALNDFNEKSLAETKSMLPASMKVFTKVFDVSNKDEMYKFADDVMAKFGRVDVMINNAGVAVARHRTNEVSYEDYNWIIGINFWGVMYGSMAFLPYLRKQKESSLVNFSSIFGLHGIPGQAPYAISKFAVRGLTESLQLEEKIHKTGVAVSAVHPGGVKTNIAKASRGAEHDPKTIEKFEKTFITSPDKAAKIIINGIRRKKSRILVGIDAVFFSFFVHKARFIAKAILSTAYKNI